MKKILLLILALSLALVAFAGCSDKGNETPTGTTPPNGEQPTTDPGNNNTPPGLPPYEFKTEDFGGEEVTMLAMQGKIWQFEDYVTNAEILNEALVARNDKLETDFNCTMTYTYCDHKGSVFSSWVASDAMTQTGAYDMVFTATGDRADTTMYYVNLMDYPVIAMEYPHYAKAYNDVAVLNNRLYGVVGYGSINFMEGTSAMVWNKDMYANYFETPIYDYVDSRNWTIEIMMNMAKAVEYDEDGDGVLTIETGSKDRVGLAISKFGGQSLFFSAGCTFMPKGEDGIPTYNFRDQHNIDVFERLTFLMNQTYVYLKDDYMGIRDIFNAEQTLFGAHAFSSIKMIKYSGTPIDYGVVPYPLWNNEQTRYYSGMSLCEDFGILTSAKDIERSAILINAYNYYSWQIVKPAYFDALLKLQVAQDPDASRMIDLIMEGATYDFGYMYNKELGGHCSYAFTMACEGKNQYASWYRQNEEVIMGYLDIMLTNYGYVVEE